MTKRFSDALGAIMAAVTLAYIVDSWSEGALSRGVREALRKAPAIVPAGPPMPSASEVSALHREARLITEGWES